MLEFGVICLRPLASLQFRWIVFSFCDMSDIIELGETVQNLTR